MKTYSTNPSPIFPEPPEQERYGIVVFEDGETWEHINYPDILFLTKEGMEQVEEYGKPKHLDDEMIVMSLNVRGMFELVKEHLSVPYP